MSGSQLSTVTLTFCVNQFLVKEMRTALTATFQIVTIWMMTFQMITRILTERVTTLRRSNLAMMFKCQINSDKMHQMESDKMLNRRMNLSKKLKRKNEDPRGGWLYTQGIFFLWVSHLRLDQWEDGLVVGWLNQFYCLNTLPATA